MCTLTCMGFDCWPVLEQKKWYSGPDRKISSISCFLLWCPAWCIKKEKYITGVFNIYLQYTAIFMFKEVIFSHLKEYFDILWSQNGVHLLQKIYFIHKGQASTNSVFFSYCLKHTLFQKGTMGCYLKPHEWVGVSKRGKRVKDFLQLLASLSTNFFWVLLIWTPTPWSLQMVCLVSGQRWNSGSLSRYKGVGLKAYTFGAGFWSQQEHNTQLVQKACNKIIISNRLIRKIKKYFKYFIFLRLINGDTSQMSSSICLVSVTVWFTDRVNMNSVICQWLKEWVGKYLQRSWEGGHFVDLTRYEESWKRAQGWGMALFYPLHVAPSLCWSFDQ